MDVLLESLTAEWHSLLKLLPRLVLSLIIVSVCILIGKLISRAIGAVLTRGNLTQTHLRFFKGLTVWLLGIVGVIVGLNVLGLKGLATSLVAGGGITAVVVGFALRGIGENFLAGFFLAFSRPFEIGDLIQSSDFQGQVKGIELRSTHIRTADGRDIYIPSSQIFGTPLVNYTKDGLRRISFKVGIDYGDDLRMARAVLIKTIAAVDGVLSTPASGVNIAAMAAQYVELEVFFWIDTFRAGISLPVVRSEVIQQTREALRSGGFTFSSDVTTTIAVSRWPSVDIGRPGQPEMAG